MGTDVYILNFMFFLEIDDSMWREMWEIAIKFSLGLFYFISFSVGMPSK